MEDRLHRGKKTARFLGILRIKTCTGGNKIKNLESEDLPISSYKEKINNEMAACGISMEFAGT